MTNGLETAILRAKESLKYHTKTRMERVELLEADKLTPIQAFIDCTIELDMTLKELKMLLEAIEAEEDSRTLANRFKNLLKK